MTIEVGAVLRGRYRLDALIGRGGMGNVFSATDIERGAAGANVAIKVVSKLLFDDVLMARLHREAEAATIIRSDFVPRVLEVAETENGEVFLVMERLVGEALSARMHDRGALPWSEVRQIGEDVLRGLIDAHTAGIVHRDLKPSNVFLAMRGGRVRAMVLDFGVCKIEEGKDAERLTGTGESIGTVAYMAPEQIRGAAQVDDRADLFAFGVMVFEMLCVRLPHDGPSQMAILATKLENEAAPLRDHARVPVPAGLHEIVMKALAREPAQRFKSAQELLKAWRALETSGMVQATPGIPFAPGARDSEPATEAVSVPKSSRPPRPRVSSDHPTLSASPRAIHGALAAPHVDALGVEGTQTGLTTGISFKRGSSRLAFVLAGCGLVLGFAGVVAFFARSPKRPDALATTAIAATAPAASAASPSGITSAEPSGDPPADSVDDVDDPPPGAAPSGAVSIATAQVPPPGAPRPAGRGRGRARTSPVPRPSGPHITDKPRY